jgi:DNA primase
MTRDQARAYVKNQLTSYLSEKGIEYRDGKKFICLNPEHTDHTPSMEYNPEKNNVHCFSCGATYDLIDLIGNETGLSGGPLFSEVYRRYGLQVDSEPGYTENHKQPETERIHNTTYTTTHTQTDHTQRARGLLSFFY